MIGSYAPDGPATPRQVAVLAGAARGETMLETARRLHVSPHTVDVERRAAYMRLGARNLANAVAIAKDRGLI